MINRGYKLNKQYRLQGWDYTSNGYYFVTICTKHRKQYFGEIVEGKMILSEIGWIVKRQWKEIPKHRENIRLDSFVIMPNHVHGIIQINCRNIPRKNNYHKYDGRNIPRYVPTENHFRGMVKNSLSLIVNQYKGSVKRICNRAGYDYFAWQSRYHDRIIRDEKELNAKRFYIKNNPANWYRDRNN